MKIRNLLWFSLTVLATLSLFTVAVPSGRGMTPENPYTMSAMEMMPDTIPPVKPREGDFITGDDGNPFDLKDPPAINQSVEYDPATGLYIVMEKVGDDYYRTPTYMTFEEYQDWMAEKEQKEYFHELVTASNASAGEDPITPYKSSIQDGLMDRLFGPGGVDIRPQGNIDLTFGGDYQKVENPILPARLQRQGGFNFDMNIQLNVVGKIGKRLKLTTNYNTQATFDFDNQIKLEFSSDDVYTEDGILKKIEAGNVSLPLKSSLIQGTQSLFGIKTQLQFGKLMTTLVVSQQQSRRNEINIQGGSQTQSFSVNADAYDENRHYFLTHYNRNNYERSLQNMPQVNSLFHVTRIEVWATNTNNRSTERLRSIMALADIGEADGATLNNPSAVSVNSTAPRDLSNKPLPDNESNNLYQRIKSNRNARNTVSSGSTLSSTYHLEGARDFVQVNARKLSTSEYTFQPDLGMLSLNAQINPGDVVGVAFQYLYNGKTYQVGEFAQDLPPGTDSLSVLFVKMLKSTTPNVKFPIWDLMMKNVYSLNAFQINPQDFRLDIAYQDPGGGEKRFLPDGPAEGTPLLNILNLDKLNRSNDPYPDGQFDFVPGLTILPQNGKIIFPKLEPFGSSLIPALSTNGVPDAAAVNKYVYQQLYDSTVTKARFYPEYNRFVIRGSFKSSSSSDISLGAFNIPRNSVRVTSGGRQLAEGTDYTIDYSLGRIKILDPSLIESGSPIKVSFEDNSVLGFQTKSLMGARFDYLVNKDLTIGGTFMRLSERPFTQKVNIGDDPILNNVLGLDAQYSKDAPWLTKLLDKLPFFSTKTMSKIQFSGEIAVLKPGHPKVIDQGTGAGGTVYLDDFEGSAARTPLGLPANSWVLASVPQDDGTGANPRFPEAKLLNNYLYGANRAALSWYNLDPIFARGQVTEVPVNSLPTDEMAYIREVDRRDIFPAFTTPGTTNTLIRTFDLAFNPERRGPYNFDAEPVPGFTAGVDPASGGLLNPKSRWGGIMRRLDNTDFEAANIEYVEFWVMSPFKNGQNVDGADLYIELGNLSEDILRDGQRSVENGLPGPNGNVPIISTGWAQIPQTQIITNAFDNDPAVRTLQDVGLDGKTDTLERNTGFSQNYLTRLSSRLTGGASNPAYARAEADPSADNFKYYLDETLNNVPLPESIFDNPVINHYSVFNGTEGNSQPNAGGDIVTSSTNLPDDEDVVKDNTLQNRDREAYFQYKVPLRPSTNGEMLTSNSKFFTSSVENDYTVASGTDNVTWYQVKIPVDQFTEKVGDLDLRNIQFIRMYLTNASEQIVLRLAEFSLVRNQWRRYSRSLKQPGIIIPGDVANNTTFDVNQVSIEENGSRMPFNYILPPGVQREQLVGSIAANARQNEQALSLRLCNLQDGDARGIFKNLNLDMRVYKRLKMFVHAEPFPADQIINPGEVTCFLRLGSDFEKNYYEYEIPLTMSATGVQTAENVWLPENTFDFPLELLRQAKVLRNSINGNLNTPFVLPTGDPDLPSAKISVIGNPDLGLVESVMIGIRNPLSSDGQSQCLEVWVNELRLTGFDEQGGIAALGRLDVTLADLGTLNFSGSYKGIGWGAIDQKVQQRSREAVATYGSAMRLDLDKFLPKQWGIKLPFLVQIDNEIRTPQYDPYQLDIKLRDRLNAATDATERAKIRQEALSVHNITSFNFTNVRKERNPKSTRKPMPWDIANFSVGYSYKRDYLRTPLIAGATMLIQEGNLNYTYAGQGKPIMPFNKLIKKGTYLKWLKEFNFNLLPSSLTFTNNLLRRYGQTQYRFAGDNSTFFEKQFLWDRNYGLNWDLTKSLRLTFNAVNNSLVDETNFGPPVRDEIVRGLQKGGRNKNYTQNVALSYQAPFKLLPITDWIDVKAQYNATFGWSAAALNTDSLGNVIRNTQSRQINGDFNFSNLYNKVKYLKAINTPPVEGKGKNNKESAAEGANGEDGKGGGGKGIKDNTKTKVTKEAAADAGKNKDNKSADGKGKDGKGADGKGADGKDADGKGPDGKEKKKKEREITFAERALLRPLMAIRKVRFNYTEEMSTIVPGFKPVHRALGQDFTAGTAPGYDFAFGRQVNGSWLDKAASNGWITSNIFLNAQFVQTHTINYDAQINVEPFRDFKLDIDFKKTIVDNYSEYFKVKDNDSNGAFSHLNPMSIGNYNFTFLSLRTMFADGLFSGKKDSTTFKQFEDNRLIISQRLGRGTHENPADSTAGYTNGYGRYQQDVLIPAFLAAYQGKSAASIFLGDIRKLFPAPNWRLTYNGLTKLKPFSKIFSNFSLTHGYKSTLTVNSFQTNLDFADNPTRTDPTTGSFYAQYNIPDLVISEQFSPLIGVDMKFKNDFTAKMDFKKSRTLALTFIDYQLAETKTTELVMGFGFRLKNKNLIALLSGKKPKKKPSKGGKEVKEDANKPSKGGSLANLGLGEIKPQHDLNFKFDFSFRDDKTFNHRIDQDNNVPTRGSMSYRISPSVDYIINNRLTIRAFFDYTRTVPATSISFPITNAQGGITVRFSLAQ